AISAATTAKCTRCAATNACTRRAPAGSPWTRRATPGAANAATNHRQEKRAVLRAAACAPPEFHPRMARVVTATPRLLAAAMPRSPRILHPRNRDYGTLTFAREPFAVRLPAPGVSADIPAPSSLLRVRPCR